MKVEIGAAQFFGAIPPEKGPWAKFSAIDMEASIAYLVSQYGGKDIVKLQSGHVFVTITVEEPSPHEERVVLLEFPGTYASTLTDEYVRAMEKTLTGQLPDKP